MKIKHEAIFVFVVLFFISPVLAANLTITGSSLAPVYANTNSTITVLNLSLNLVENDNVSNITFVNVTIVGGEIGNISGVEIRNSTDAVLGGNKTNATATTFIVYLTSDHVFNESTNSSLKIVLNISRSA